MRSVAWRGNVWGEACACPSVRACCFVGIGAIALFSLFNFSQAIPAEISLEERLANASILRRVEVDGGFVRQFDVSKSVVLLRLWKSDSTIVVAYDLDGNQLFRKGFWDAPGRRIGSALVSADGSTVIISEAIGNERWRYRVFDIDGTLRFELDHSSFPIPSPRGKYFCTIYDEVSSSFPMLLGSDGAVLRQFTGILSGWSVRFLNDEQLVIVDRDSAYFVATATGNTARTVPLNMTLPPYLPNPEVRVNPADSIIAVFWYRELLLLDWTGKELLRQNLHDDLYSVVFDTDLPQMALILESPGAGSGYVRVTRLAAPWKTVRSVSLPILANNARRDVEVTSFSKGVVTVLGPVSASLGAFEPGEHYWTLLLELRLDSLIIGEPVVRSGLYQAISTSVNRIVYLQIQPLDKVSLISIASRERIEE